MILLPNTKACHAGEIAERMRLCIRDDLPETDIKISCSFGVAILNVGDTAQSLLNRADGLLLQAKTGGKNRVVNEGGAEAEAEAKEPSIERTMYNEKATNGNAGVP